jgi:haloacetate dehalogenase
MRPTVMTMFEGFESRRVEGHGAEIFLRIGGSGAPVLLLHGYPQTHATWHRVAPALASRFTVVCPDLRGYGDSSAPPSDATHAPYSKRVMAQDMVEVMRGLGFPQFAVVGHDRGGRVAYRMALDHPTLVSRLAVLDMGPTLEVWERIDMARALHAFHWQFLAQPAPLPETMIGHDPDFFLERLLRSWAAPGFTFDPAALEAYHRAFHKPTVIQATCEDYRAGATIDPAHDAADRKAGHRIRCPVLALWGAAEAGKPSAILTDVWRRWADEVSGAPLPCGHFLPEEAPEELLRHLRAFLDPTGPPKGGTTPSSRPPASSGMTS